MGVGGGGGTLVHSTGNPNNQVLFPNLTVRPYMTFHESVVSSMPPFMLLLNEDSSKY